MNVTFYENVAVIDGGNGQVNVDVVRSIRRSDRRYDSQYRRWIVRNPERYLQLPAFSTANEDRRRQMDFFDLFGDRYKHVFDGSEEEKDIQNVLDEIFLINVDGFLYDLNIRVGTASYIASAAINANADGIATSIVSGGESATILGALQSLRDTLIHGWTKCPTCGLSPRGKSEISMVPSVV